MNAEEYFEEHHVPRHSKLIKGCGLLYQESEIPKLMEAYHQEQVKKLNIDDVSKCVHPHRNLSSGDEGLFCDKSQTYISKDSHIC